MAHLKSIITFAGGMALLATLASGQVPNPASSNATISSDGPTSNPWFHNAQVVGEFQSYAISSFRISRFGDGNALSIDTFDISYTQANAGFTTDGPVEFFITFDETVSRGDYSGLFHNGSASGIDDSQFSDSPSTQSLGTATFTEVESGTVDSYTLDFSPYESQIVEAINEGKYISIILSATGSEGAVTYAGIENNTYPGTIALTVGGTMDNRGDIEGSGLLITGVMDGPLPGGLPKVIELYARHDIPDLSAYGVESANNGGGRGGQELTLSGSASAGDFIWIASEDVEFTNVFGVAPDFVDGVANINGDDAIVLYFGQLVVDVFGVTDVDGSGEPWEYLDGWAYRVSETLPDRFMNIEDWTFSGPDALDDLDAAGVAAAVPFGTYVPPAVVEPDPLPWNAEGLEAGDFGVSPWFGGFEVGAGDWILHSELGWLWVGYAESSDSMWFYSYYWNTWLWSSEELFPIVYATGSNAWLYYFIVEDVGAFVFNYSTYAWSLNP